MTLIKKLIIVCFVCISMLPIKVFADEVYTEGYFQYKIQNNTIEIVGYYGSESEVFIPESIGEMPVVTIKKDVFYSPNIQTIHIPETVTTVESGAFTKATGLTTIYNASEKVASQLPSNVTVIEDYPQYADQVIIDRNESLSELIHEGDEDAEMSEDGTSQEVSQILDVADADDPGDVVVTENKDENEETTTEGSITEGSEKTEEKESAMIPSSKNNSYIFAGLGIVLLIGGVFGLIKIRKK